MTADPEIVSFSTLRDDLWRLQGTLTGEHRELLGEAEHRLDQLDCLLEDIVRVGGEAGSDKHGVRVKTYAEAFYYCASRAVDLVERVYGRDSLKRQSGGSLIGVSDVRHNLIEHAERASGVMAINWAFDLPELVVLKPFGGPNRTVFDRGLRANAEELHDRLSELLRSIREQS